MNAYEDHAAMLDALSAEQAAVPNLDAFWNGMNFKLLPGGAKFSRKNGRGGFDLGCDLMLTCTTAQFGGNAPDAGQPLSYMGRNYTIREVTTPGGAYQVRLHCMLTNAEKT